MAFTTTCPACSEELDVDEEHRDWTVRCPRCRHEFRAESSAPRPERYSPPRRRRRRRYDEDDEPNFHEAYLKVAGPARFLEVLGWLSTLASIGLAAMCIVLGTQGMNQPGKAGEDAGLLIFLGACLGVFAVPYSLVMAIGGHKMRNLSSRKWAMTAAIFGIAAIVVFGLFGVFHIAAGIWALTALLDRNVEDCFRAKSRKRYKDTADEEGDEEDDYAD